jgi:hypothetical protein
LSGVAIVHTWQCPTHGVLHTFESDPSNGTDVAATSIAVKAHNSIVAKGCPTLVMKDRREVACGDHVTHLAEPKS